MDKPILLCALIVATSAGCAAFVRAPFTVKTACPPEQVWDAAIESLDGLTVREADKANGVIATGWAFSPSTSAAGVFQRKANQERARFFLNVEFGRQDAAIAIRQTREYFSPMGVQSQSTRWKRIPPAAEEEQLLAQTLSGRLKDKGCRILP